MKSEDLMYPYVGLMYLNMQAGSPRCAPKCVEMQLLWNYATTEE